MSTLLINVGLESVLLDPREVRNNALACLSGFWGGALFEIATDASGELCLVAEVEFSRAQHSKQHYEALLTTMSTACGQDCIAVLGGFWPKGALIGQATKGYGKFQASLFTYPMSRLQTKEH